MISGIGLRLLLTSGLLALIACGHRSNDYGSLSSDSIPANLIELPVKIENSSLKLAGHLNFITSYEVQMSGCASHFVSTSHNSDEKIKAVLGDTGCMLNLNSLTVYYYYEYRQLAPGSNTYVSADVPGHQLILQNLPSFGDTVDESDSLTFKLIEVDSSGSAGIVVEAPPEPDTVSTEVLVTSDDAPDFFFHSSVFAGYDAGLRPKFQFKLQCDSKEGSIGNLCGSNPINAEAGTKGLEFALLPGNADITFNSDTLKNAQWTPVTNYIDSFFTADVTAPEAFSAGTPIKMIFIMKNSFGSFSFYRITVTGITTPLLKQ